MKEIAKEIITDELLDLLAEEYFALKNYHVSEDNEFTTTFIQFVEQKLKERSGQ